MKAWNVGDVVVLNSGGPAMTVTGVTEEGRWVEVEWVYEGLRQSSHFPPICLRQLNALEKVQAGGL